MDYCRLCLALPCFFLLSEIMIEELTALSRTEESRMTLEPFPAGSLDGEGPLELFSSRILGLLVCCIVI